MSSPGKGHLEEERARTPARRSASSEKRPRAQSDSQEEKGGEEFILGLDGGGPETGGMASLNDELAGK